MESEYSSKGYWEKNIDKFSKFYTENSSEDLIASSFMSFIYKKLIIPIERMYMKKRHNIVTKFIRNEISEDDIVADIGCGCGIYTEMSLQKGAKVYALDFADSALELTKKWNSDACETRLVIKNIDIAKENLPKANVALMIGVLPYIENVSLVFKHTLPFTDKIIFSFLNESNMFNKLRKGFKFLDVRRYNYQKLGAIQAELVKHGFKIYKNIPLATGKVIIATRSAS